MAIGARFFDPLRDQAGNITLQSIENYLIRANSSQDNSVFLSILLVFLRLYRFLQDDINKLTAKHLKFYYEQVLGFRRKPAQADTVHVIFELTPQANATRIAAGTALRAGQDALGRPLIYRTDREIIVNQAQLAQIRTVLRTKEGRIFAAEVANSEDGLGAPLAGEPAKWPTFGDPAFMQPSTVGFAIASHLLLLREGMRTITLTLRLGLLDEAGNPIPSNRAFERLQAFASGEADWVQLNVKEAVVNNGEVKLTIEAANDQPAILTYDANVLDGNIDTSFPVLRLMLDPQASNYEDFENLKIEQVNIQAKVEAEHAEAGVKNLIVQNDFGVLDANSAFEPFGATPANGGNFFMGSNEVFSKPLQSLKLNIDWGDYPGNLEDYYKDGYDSRFKLPRVDSDIRISGTWRAAQTGIDLFNTGNFNKSISRLPSIPLMPELEELDEFSSQVNQGFLRLRLDGSFLHRDYPKLFAQEAVKDGNKTFPNTPYTPTIQALSLGYETTTQNISLNQATETGQLFHILPFGSDQLEQMPNRAHSFLPAIARGALYLGVEAFQPPQNLHLLFQVAEGSAETVNVVRRENIVWDYLTPEGWREQPLSGSEIFIDTTQGLQRSGILAFSLGRDAVNNASLMPNGLHWLRGRLVNRSASNEVDPAGAAQTIDIKTQAITAVFEDNDNDPNHLLAPLPAESIAALVQRNSAIRKVSQPYASFEGSVAEMDNGLYRRVHERLRHKQRAINLWDYERLILEQFPQVYKVKALPHTGFTDNQYSEFVPGQTTVVVIPQLRNQNAVNPLQPAASVALLEDIRRFLLGLTTQFVSAVPNALHVINPRYETIQLSMEVGFREGFDGGFYAEVLNRDLRQFLSPWAFVAGEDISFGGKIYKSQLLAFVEERAYVDYVTNFRLFQKNAGPGIGEMCVEVDFVVWPDAEADQGVDVAVASTEASILVSAQRHSIGVLQPDQFPCDEPDVCVEGIGCWIIQGDFIVQ